MFVDFLFREAELQRKQRARWAMKSIDLGLVWPFTAQVKSRAGLEELQTLQAAFSYPM